MAENWTTLHAPRKRKWVVAHFMVGNTFPYRMEDWINDIRMAHAHGIDGFALNVGREDWQRHRVSDCYEAALRAEVPFKLFLSFDMTSIPASCQGDICVLNDYVAAFAKHPSQLLYESKALVSTFAGENSLFGFSNLSAAWRYAKAVLEQTAPIHLVPSFFINPGRYPEIHAIDGYFNWNGSWPLHLTPRSPRDEIECPRLDTDYHHLHHLGGRTFMAAVSPWFFTHYGIDSWNKNWVYRGDDWLFVRRWEQLIAMRERVDIVQIISWNDYGESHYIGPIKGAQPNSEAWVDGFPHEAWLHLNGYYAKAFKDGRYHKIERDRIYMWSRPHLKEARAADTVPRPDNWELVDDAFWVVVFAVAPATIRLSTSDEDHAQSVAVQAGVSKLSHRMVAGGSMRGQLFRAGVLVTECTPSSNDFCFQEHPQVYNFNAYVAMSSN